jgi:hypothetical protein
MSAPLSHLQRTGGMVCGIVLGVHPRVSAGVSAGVDRPVDTDRVLVNPSIGVCLKVRLTEHRDRFPSIAIGFDNQGFGGIERGGEYRGYVYQSRGFFLAISKYYSLADKIHFGFHGDMNLPIEDLQWSRWPSGYAGLQVGFFQRVILDFEFDMGLSYLSPGERLASSNPFRGLFNAGVRWYVMPRLFTQIALLDILKSKTVQSLDSAGRRRIFGWQLAFTAGYVYEI